MNRSGSVSISETQPIFGGSRCSKLFTFTTTITIIFVVLTFVLSILTFVKVKTDYEVPTTTPLPPYNPSLVTSIRIDDVMRHLQELQKLATASGGTRAVNTQGFNDTLDYIVNYLSIYTNFFIKRSYFYVKDFTLAKNPILISSIDGVIRNYTYSTDLSFTDFTFVRYSAPHNNSDFIGLTVIPNLACNDSDWQNASPPVAGRAAIVKRGDCPFAEKGRLAEKYNATALLLYNDGTSPDRFAPISVSLSQNNTVPALFVSYIVAESLIDAAQNESNNVDIQLNIELKDLPDFPVGNICADTPTGNVTQTIVIGSHSDSVPAGPGINDNGSGSAANLALAVALYRLYKSTAYQQYKYRVRFCWWGAEELGLLGSAYHVSQAKVATEVGERLEDYLINLNYDMLASPNYFFGIYDGDTAPQNTPAKALPGSLIVTEIYQNWFDSQKLPSDLTVFSGRSDYGPFLAEGIVAGGLFSGADETKTQEMRSRYDEILGQGMGGIPGITADPCYHQACDSIQNINVFAYEKMVQAAAYILEYLGQQNDLKSLLYPNITMDG